MVHAGADDRRIAREAGATVVLCPRSNLHIGGRLPDVDALLADGVPLALGTDSLASTPDLSLWGEMATLAAHFPAVPAARWLDAATRGGARALGPARRSARSRPGARPGVLDVLVDDVAAPLESLVRDPHPDPALGGARMTHRDRHRDALGPASSTFGRMIKFEHTLFALPFALAAAAHRRARPRPVDRARRRHRRRDGGRAHRRDGLQPHRRPPHRREEPAHRRPRAADRARSRCAPPGR